MNSLHKYIPKHRQRVHKTLENKFQSEHNPRLHLHHQPTFKSGRQIPIFLIYKKNKITVVSYFGMDYAELSALLYREIIIREKKEKGLSFENAEKEARKVLGFSTSSNDLKTDYLMSIKKGNITKSLLLECFMETKKTNRVLNYQIYSCLAIGGFSKVYLARSREDGKFYAVKFIKKMKDSNSFNEKSILNEMQIGEKVSHPFLISMRESFETQGFFCMIFDYCPGGELFFLLKRIKKMSEENSRFFFIQILLGIEYLHKNSIVYRDLKPENILIDWEGNSKIVDFGLSKALAPGKERTFSYCGSAEYMAPEMVLRCGHSYSIDYYSLGALLYELVVGLPPFYSKDPGELQESIITEELAFPSNIPLSTQIKDFLIKLLQKDARYRLGSLAGVKEIMVHPWIGKFKSEDFMKKNVRPPFPPDLKAHNFDLEELGDDEEQFTNQIYLEFSRNAKTTAKALFKPREESMVHLYHYQIKDVVVQLKQQEIESLQKFQMSQKKTARTQQKTKSQQKVSRHTNYENRELSVQKVREKRSLHNLTFSQRNNLINQSKSKQEKVSKQTAKEAMIKAKLLPYFTKSKISKPRFESYDKENIKNKKIARTNILKLNIFQNLTQDKLV